MGARHQCRVMYAHYTVLSNVLHCNKLHHIHMWTCACRPTPVYFVVLYCNIHSMHTQYVQCIDLNKNNDNMFPLSSLWCYLHQSEDQSKCSCDCEWSGLPHEFCLLILLASYRKRWAQTLCVMYATLRTCRFMYAFCNVHNAYRPMPIEQALLCSMDDGAPYK